MEQTRRVFLRNAALSSGAFTLGSLTGKGQAFEEVNGSAAGAGGSALFRLQFQAPPSQYRPIVRWWWPGNGVTDAELRREIDVLDKAGFGGAEIQAFVKGLPTPDFSQAQWRTINSFASESFFRHVATAADEARKHGMFIDYTFGSGWPFGGGEAITPELASIELRSTVLSVEGPAKLHQQLQIPSITDGDPLHGSDRLKGLPDGWAARLKKRTKIVAVVAVRGQQAQWNFHAAGGPRQFVVKPGQLENGTSLDLTSRLQLDGTLDWDVPPGTWQLFVFCSIPTMQRLNGAAGEGPRFVMDHLSAEAFAAHAKRVGDNAVPFLAQYFGNGLRAIFCDSLEVGANLFWSDDFLIEFRRRRGYDLLPYLPILKLQSYNEPFGEYVDLPVFDMTDIGDQVRHDYRKTVSDLMAERFYGQFNNWAHQHNLLSRTQAHGSPTDVLRIYGEADIPETEDLYDKGAYDFLKLAASAAHVYGKSIVGSESFVWPQAAYQTTPEKMKLAADELFTAGVNAIVYHGFPYIVPQIPLPGWHPFNGYYGEDNYSSQFNELNPIWPCFAQLNAYFTRIQYVSQVGTDVAAIALYRNDLVHGAGENPPAPQLNQALMDAGYNYDHINAESLLHCVVDGHEIMTSGKAGYRALVFPATTAIDATLAEKLQQFAAAGLPILFEGQLPSGSDSFFDKAKHTERVQAAMRNVRAFSNVHSGGDSNDVIAVLKQGVTPNIRFHGNPLPFIQKRIGGVNAFFVRNASDETQHLNAEFETKGIPELWDPWTGRTETIATYHRKGSWVQVNLDFQPCASALIVFDPDGAAPEAIAVPKPRSVRRAGEIGASGWKLVATGLSPSGKMTAIQRNLRVLIDWSLDSDLRGLSGRGVYTTKFTTFAADTGSRFILDLGNVKNVADIKLNGKRVATLLLRPYRCDITDFTQPGENLLELAVTNTLFNSMVLRDERPFRPGPTENPSGLVSAGLIGPVQLLVMD